MHICKHNVLYHAYFFILDFVFKKVFNADEAKSFNSKIELFSRSAELLFQLKFINAVGAIATSHVDTVQLAVYYFVESNKGT